MAEKEKGKKKKRKNRHEDEDRPRKRHATELDINQTVKFTFRDDPGPLGPAIVTAPGLDIPPDLEFEPYIRPKGSAQQTDGRVEGELLLHASRSSKLDYVAQEDPSGVADGLMKHYMGIYDPMTGECELIPARRLTVQAIVRSTASDDEDQDDGAQSNLAKRIDLSQTFGNKKAQTALRSLTENAIKSSGKLKTDADGNVVLDKAAATVINAMADKAQVPSREVLEIAAREAKPVPKANLEAQTVEDVYSIEELVGPEMLAGVKVKEWQDAVAEDQDVLTTSVFVSRRVRKIAASGEAKRLKLLKLLLGLLEWHRCLKPGRKGGKSLPTKEDVANAVKSVSGRTQGAIQRKFAPDIQMNRWAIDYFMTHVCALALIIDNFETNIADLREDLRLETQEIAQYFRELGCRVKKPTEKQQEDLKLKKAVAATFRIAKLRLPLEFPKQRVIVLKKR